MAVFLSNEELDALHGLPHSAIALYVMGIRQMMDSRTRLAGSVNNISWRTLCQWTYINPGPGRPVSGDSHISSARRQAKVLERAGLIVPKGGDFLVFLCPLAQAPSLVRNKPDTKSTGYPDRVSKEKEQALSKAYEGLQIEPDRGEMAEPDSVLRSKIYQSSSSVNRCGEEDNNSPPAAGKAPQEQEDPINSPPPAGGMETPPGLEAGALTFPPAFTPAQEKAACREMQTAGQAANAQALLDELTGHMQKPGGIRNPLAYLRSIIATAEAQGPEWIPDHAERIKTARERQNATSRAVAMAQERTETALPGVKPARGVSAPIQSLRAALQGRA